jgi:hypothetical protein
MPELKEQDTILEEVKVAGGLKLERLDPDALRELQPPEEFDLLKDLDWGVPPQHLVDQWKREFGPKNVKTIAVPGRFGVLEFYFRLITRAEYKGLLWAPLDAIAKENELLNRAVLWPANVNFYTFFADQLQGLPSVLIEHVFDASGFVPVLDVKNA